jgi:hypothetical protein
MSFGSIIQSGGGLSYPTVRPKFDLNLIRNRSIPPEYSYTRNSSGTYVGSDGLIKTATINEPRFDYDPTTGESLGLLVEEARTNIIVSSPVFNTGGWNQDGVVLTANAGVAPDGTTTATSVSQGTGNNRCFHFDNSGVTGNKVFSFFAKANAGTSFQLTAVGGQTPNATVTVNLSSGTVSGFSGATIQLFASGWYRVFLPVLVIIASGNSTYFSFSCPAASVFLWGTQLEAGSFPTSYIPTSGSTVTRQPDQLVLNRTLNPQGAFYIEPNTTGTSLVADNGSSTISPPQGTKSALYYNTSRTLSMSSSTTPVEGNFNVPQNLNRVSLGFDRLNNSNYINGHLKKFMYYGSPVTEDNLRSLTGNTRPTFRFGLEQIITDGLVLNLDAGNPASYPGSGTTWTDLSGNGNTGTLVNGVGYNSGNLGSLVFDDGTNNYVSGTNNNTLQLVNDLTVSAWVKLGDGANQGIVEKMIFSPYNGYGITKQSGLFKFWTASNNNTTYTNSNTTYIADNNWYYVVGRRMSGTNRLFINSILQSDSQSPPLSDSGQVYVIGRYYSDVNSYYLGGNIAQVSIYNRALTASEITQNFNALRSRFGI